MRLFRCTGIIASCMSTDRRVQGAPVGVSRQDFRPGEDDVKHAESFENIARMSRLAKDN